MVKLALLLFLLFLNISLFGQNQNDFEFIDTQTNGNQSLSITKYIGNNVNVIIPESINGIPVTSIGYKAFEQSNIETVEMSNTIISIGRDAFRGSRELTAVFISRSVINIGRDASGPVGIGIYGLDLIFDGCNKLTSINVDPDNPKYSSIEGVLFNKQMTTLIFYPHGKAGGYNVPSSLQEELKTRFPTAFDLPMDIVFLVDGGA